MRLPCGRVVASIPLGRFDREIGAMLRSDLSADESLTAVLRIVSR